MILTAHQPVYLPWLGLFHKIALSDVFCILDIVQYQKNDFNNRNKIKTISGPIWLTVPVESKGHLEKKITDIRVVKNHWQKKHFMSIDLAYKKAPFYSSYISEVEKILILEEYEYLVDVNEAILMFLLRSLGITTRVCKASEYNFEGAKSDLILDMCRKLGATDYIFGSQGRNYANVKSFLDGGIRPHFQEYKHPFYAQLHGMFVPYMSTLDLLFNFGPDSLDILMSGNSLDI